MNVATIRRVLTLFIVIGCWYRVDWTVALLMSWFSIAVEGFAVAIFKQGVSLASLGERHEVLKQEFEDKRQRRAG
jgi:hypothetical protein